MIKERLAELLSRKLSGEATADEIQELEHWLKTHPGDQYFSDILFEYWNSQHIISPVVDTAPDQHFAHILEMASGDQEDSPLVPFQKKNTVIRLIKRVVVAASIAGVIGLSVIWLVSKKNLPDKAKHTAVKNEVIATMPLFTILYVSPDPANKLSNAVVSGRLLAEKSTLFFNPLRS